MKLRIQARREYQGSTTLKIIQQCGNHRYWRPTLWDSRKPFWTDIYRVSNLRTELGYSSRPASSTWTLSGSHPAAVYDCWNQEITRESQALLYMIISECHKMYTTTYDFSERVNNLVSRKRRQKRPRCDCGTRVVFSYTRRISCLFKKEVKPSESLWHLKGCPTGPLAW